MTKRALICAAMTAAVWWATAVLPVFGDPAEVQRFRGSTQGKVKVVTSTQYQALVANKIQGTGWFQIPGASTSLTIPEGRSALVDARFSARAICSGYCLVRIRVAGGPDYILEPYLESSECPIQGCGHHPDLFGNENAPDNAAIERASGPIPAGTYSVVVEFACETSGVDCDARLELANFSLTVERLRA